MERISALMDDELEAGEREQALALLKADGQARQQWDTFHAIGDIMRGESAVRVGVGEGFAARLAAEPTVIAPRAPRAQRRLAATIWPAAASVAAVSLVGWMAFYSPLAPQQQIAATPVTASPVGAPVGVAARPAPQVAPVVVEIVNVPNDGSADEYLMAHQEYSPSTAIQGLVPYIRGVSVNQPAPGGRE